MFFIAIGDVLSQSPYVFDSERWARLKTFGGTARYMAIGGAGTALGADLGAAQVNPAGLGLCRKSQFSFSPDFGSTKSTSDYLGDGGADSRASFGFNNIGVIFCSNKDENTTDDWKGGSFAFSITRTNTFHNRMYHQGVNDKSSMTDYFVENSYFNSPDYDDDFNPLNLNALAFDAYLTDYDAANDLYKNFLNDDVVKQEDRISTKGRIWQMDFAYGANYKDKIYLGAAVGFTNLRYTYERTYSETVGLIFNKQFKANVDTLDYFSYSDYLRTTGAGINLKVGIIAKPNDMVRIGLNVQTPTYFYSMRDNYNTSLEAYYDGTTVIGTTLLDFYKNSTPEGEFRYTYTSPARLSGGIALFASKLGFISGELEYVPYNSASFGTSDNVNRNYFNDVNADIRKIYEATVNYKLGGELRLGTVKLRAGMNIISDPYVVTDKSLKQHLYQYSGGLGFKLDKMTIDLAMIHGRTKSKYAPYTTSFDTPEANVLTRSTNFVITTGFFFD
jgi:hypothetical protein